VRASVLALFPAGVAGAELTDFALAGPLWPGETQAVERAVHKRVAEFTAGRHAARQALAALGEPQVAIPRGVDRTPQWPAGVLGSISHCAGYCGAVVARASAFRGLGFDVEPIGSVRPEVWSQIAQPGEIDAAAAVDPSWATVLFSGKEAFYKAQFAITRTWVGFRDVELVRLDEGSFEVVATPKTPPAVAPLLPARGSYRVEPGHVFTAVAFPASAFALR
jgi:enterobactin synthetase component D